MIDMFLQLGSITENNLENTKKYQLPSSLKSIIHIQITSLHLVIIKYLSSIVNRWKHYIL